MLIDDYLIDDGDFDLELPDIDYPDMPNDDDGTISSDEDFLDEVMNEHEQDTNHMTFCGHDTLPPNANSDGYIPSGTQELTSTIADIQKTFKLYTKDGHDYVLYNGSYYRIDGSGTVTIGGVKYDKI